LIDAFPSHHLTDSTLAARRLHQVTRFAWSAAAQQIPMATGLFQASTIPVLEQAVNFAEARHNVLAGNIANIDTPGYRARDLSTEVFQQRLKDAIEARHRSESEGYDLAGSDSPAGSDPAMNLDDAFQTILRHDDGKVSMEQQVAELTKNQMQYNTALAVLTEQFHLLEAAINEQA
jgi:flagellar basal-body rod protein FlgB